jgi:hypothetical protein
VTTTEDSSIPADAAPAGVDSPNSSVGVRFPSADRWVFAGLGGLAAYVAVFVVALVVTLLALLSFSNLKIDWSWLFLFPAQLIGLSLGGTFSAGSSGLGLTASVTLLWAPLLLTAAMVVAVVLVARRDEKIRPTAPRSTRWMLSGTTGLVVAIVSVVFALILVPRINPGSSDSSQLDLSGFSLGATSASVSLFFGALVVATVAAYLARRSVGSRGTRRAGGQVELAARAGLPVVLLYVIVLGVLLGVTLIIVVPIKAGAAALLVAPLWLPTIVGDAIAALNLSVLSIGGGIASLPGVSSVSFSMLGNTPWWTALIAIVVNIALLVVVATILRLRRADNSLGSWPNWLTTVVGFAVVGILVSVLSSVAAWSHIDAGALGSDGGSAGIVGEGIALFSSLASTSATFGPAAWTVLVFALVGAIVELLAIFVSPLLLGLLPVTLVSRGSRFFAKVGIPISAESAVAGSAPLVPSEAIPMTPERRRLVVIIVAIVGSVVAVVILAVVAISIVNAVVLTPQVQVQNYLAAIQSKDAEGAIAIGDVNAARSSRALLTDAVLKKTAGGLTGYQVLSTTRSGDVANVLVRLDQDGAKSQASFTVRESGKSWLFFDRWQLDPVSLPQLAIEVPAGVQSLSINGATVPLTGDDVSDGVLQLPAFPGRYQISLGGHSTWLSAQQKSVVASMGDGASLPTPTELTLVPTRAFTASVGDQISALVAGCATTTTADPAGCPFEGFTIDDSAVSWAVATQPTFHLESQLDGTWSVVTDAPGDATMSYVWDSGFGVFPQSEDISIYIDGAVSFEGGKPVYAYQAY